MPYNSKALNLSQRDWLLSALWLGVPASLLYLAGQFVALPRPLDYLPGAFCAGLLVGLVFKSQHDEYVVRLAEQAGRVALGVAGLLMVVTLPLFGPLLIIDSGLGLAVIAAAFNLALGWFRLTSARP